MKLKGIKSVSIIDIVSELQAKGVAILQGGADDARPQTSRFQSALAQRIAAANMMWGASDVVDFKVRGCEVVLPACLTALFAAQLRFQPSGGACCVRCLCAGANAALQVLPLTWTSFGTMWDSIFQKAYMQVALSV
jgi:hypothetical protein